MALRLLPAFTDDEDNDDGNFTKWMSSYWGHGAEGHGSDRKHGCRRAAGTRGDRRASLPTVSQLDAMKLNRIHAATMAPSPSHMKGREEMMEVRNQQRAHRSSSDDNSRSKSGIPEKRISTIPELTESFERRLFLRDERTTSLNGDDDDKLCLICHEDMKKSGRPVQELHCSHRAHKQCMELWKKQTCRSRRVHVFMPRRLYWSSSRINVPQRS
ncbi:leukemia NUP98 fusion partner 1 [Lycodopsis pacificus]